MISFAAVFTAITLAVPWVPRAERVRHATDIAAAAPSLVVAKAMIATATVESGFRKDVERCECREGECDAGLAVSVYQLHWYHFAGHTAEEICASNRLATALAARVLSGLARQLGGDMTEAIRVYVGMRVKRDDVRIKPRLELFERLMEAHTDEP